MERILTQSPLEPPMPTPAFPKTLAVIPARYASTRFPGKPLVLIDGKPMIQHVWERTRRVPLIDRVIVATDDTRILDAVEAFGGEARMTSPQHPSGTDRVWEVAATLPEYDLILNVQGDEPNLNPDHLEQVIAAMAQTPEAAIYTLVSPLDPTTDPEAWANPNIVKAVLTATYRALYFSRSPIPFLREPLDTAPPCYRHAGLYLYRRNVLEQLTQLPPSPLELTEKLEQLRALETGFPLYAWVADQVSAGVDTPGDLDRLVRQAPGND